MRVFPQMTFRLQTEIKIIFSDSSLCFLKSQVTSIMCLAFHYYRLSGYIMWGFSICVRNEFSIMLHFGQPLTHHLSVGEDYLGGLP